MPPEPPVSTGNPGAEHGGKTGHRPQGDDPVGPTEPATPQRWARVKGALGAFALLALLVTAILGSDVLGLRGRVFGSARPTPRPPAVSRQADAPTAGTADAQKTVLRSQPWWQSVTTLSGVGPMTAPTFSVASDAVQWRVKWTCQSGRITVKVSNQPKPVVDGTCPGNGSGYGTATGEVSLQVQADGPWEMQADQQVDVPLIEPLLPEMTAPGSEKVSSGSFYRIDQTGSGTATIYHLVDGRYALRLDDFFVTANSELEVKLSALQEPKTSNQFTDAPSALVAPLEVTTGSLNFTLPPDVDPTQYKSVVVWCRLINSAYSGATLRPAQ